MLYVLIYVIIYICFNLIDVNSLMKKNFVSKKLLFLLIYLKVLKECAANTRKRHRINLSYKKKERDGKFLSQKLKLSSNNFKKNLIDKNSKESHMI